MLPTAAEMKIHTAEAIQRNREMAYSNTKKVISEAAIGGYSSCRATSANLFAEEIIDHLLSIGYIVCDVNVGTAFTNFLISWEE